MRRFPDLNLHSGWVDQTFASMSIEQKIGQLLHPCLWPEGSEQDHEKALQGIEPGGVFLFNGIRQQFCAVTQWLQSQVKTPVIISSDLENGAGMMVKDATVFPDLMAVGAADDEQLAYIMGKAAAVEGRACGVHWAFGPVVDINLQPHDPITSTRCLGDNTQRIERLSRAIIIGMQEHGLCATAKHFPGGGTDNRDQHLCNTVNTLLMDQWFRLSGRMFQQAVDLGVWSIMAGHISLPAWDCGDGSHIQNATPATVSRKIITGLLREKMGFNGVVITDAMDMAGVTAWGRREQIIPAAIAAGCDMILFSDVKQDYPILIQAVKDGRLGMDTVDTSVRRILALKETLGLQKREGIGSICREDRTSFEKASETIAQKAITLVKDTKACLPLTITRGTKILSYHFRNDPLFTVDLIDELLRERGAEVQYFDNTIPGAFPKEYEGLDTFDSILLHCLLCPAWGTNAIRPAGVYMRDLWTLITSHHPQLVLVSYGTPYMSYEMPHLPCIINAYSRDPATQKAVVDVLTGALKPTGTSPVDLELPYVYQRLTGMKTF